jgi:hypothetical protein
VADGGTQHSGRRPPQSRPSVGFFRLDGARRFGKCMSC